MAKTLVSLFDEMECQKSALLSKLESWPVEHLNFRPDSDSWSALNVVSHIMKVESAFVNAAQRNLPERRVVTAKDKIGALTVISVMRSPIRVKVPPAAASAVMPHPIATLADLSRQWRDGRIALRCLIDSVQPDQLEFGVFLHPVAGWMPMATAMKFLKEHIGHHDHQLKRLKDASSKGT